MEKINYELLLNLAKKQNIPVPDTPTNKLVGFLYTQTS